MKLVCLWCVCVTGVMSLASCGGSRDMMTPAASVDRRETLTIAAQYASMRWTPSGKNILHGRAADGIKVETPDHVSAPSNPRYFWTPGRVQQGMPYQWGGFDTPQSFVAKMSSTTPYAAGDIATHEKKVGGDAAVSQFAAGIDCSGFVSRCWRLSRSYSTRELASLCEELPDYREARAGDIYLLPGVHVIMVDTQISTQSAFSGYEAGSQPAWRVNRRFFVVNELKRQGYKLYRYKNMRD